MWHMGLINSYLDWICLKQVQMMFWVQMMAEAGVWKSGNKTGKGEHDKWVTKLFAGGSDRAPWYHTPRTHEESTSGLSFRRTGIGCICQPTLISHWRRTAPLHLGAEQVRTWLSFHGFRKPPGTENQKEIRAHMPEEGWGWDNELPTSAERKKMSWGGMAWGCRASRSPRQSLTLNGLENTLNVL